MSQDDPSSREEPLFQKIIPWWHFFTLFMHPTHRPTSQNIGGVRMHMGRHPTSIFWGEQSP